MADNKVKFLRGSSNKYESSIKDNDTFYYTTDTEKLYLGNKEITGGGVTVDDTLSDTSKNPVQNKVINAALNSKADQTAVDSALAQKANSADVTASLAGKSDTGHTHDDRYYTESETNTLLGDKVGVSDFNSHTNNTTVHVTAEEKAAWNGKAELSDIPTSLPANGGNADTLDGFHETSFSRNRDIISDCNNATLPGTYNTTPETINTPYSTYWLVSVETGSNGSWIRQTATISDHSKPNETYRRLFINDKWSDSWVKVNDGGHASVADFLTTLSEDGASFGSAWQMKAQYNKTNDGTFRIYCGDGSVWTSVNRADEATSANSSGITGTASNVCLRNLSSGTSAANTTNCPVGAWYGRHD